MKTDALGKTVETGRKAKRESIRAGTFNLGPEEAKATVSKNRRETWQNITKLHK